MQVENISYYAIENGLHKNSGDDTVLIRILDTDNDSPVKPKVNFDKTFIFKFLDVDADADIDDKYKFNSDMAKEIVSIFEYCKENNKNIVVHCTAGLCRSGAIAEIASMLSFEPVHDNRMPNSLVKGLLMKELGWSYEDELTIAP